MFKPLLKYVAPGLSIGAIVLELVARAIGGGFSNADPRLVQFATETDLTAEEYLNWFNNLASPEQREFLINRISALVENGSTDSRYLELYRNSPAGGQLEEITVYRTEEGDITFKRDSGGGVYTQHIPDIAKVGSIAGAIPHFWISTEISIPTTKGKIHQLHTRDGQQSFSFDSTSLVCTLSPELGVEELRDPEARMNIFEGIRIGLTGTDPITQEPIEIMIGRLVRTSDSLSLMHPLPISPLLVRPNSGISNIHISESGLLPILEQCDLSQLSPSQHSLAEAIPIIIDSLENPEG